jgi:hypothetical protein
MLSKLMNAVFGCWHSHYSFPITVRSAKRRSPAAALTGTYVVCLDCGKELAYDWREMKILDSQPKQTAGSLVTKQAA